MLSECRVKVPGSVNTAGFLGLLCKRALTPGYTWHAGKYQIKWAWPPKKLQDKYRTLLLLTGLLWLMAAISIEKIHRKENMMFLVSEWLFFIVRPPKVLRGWDAVCDFKLAPQKTLYSTLYIFIGLNNNGGTYTQVLTIFFFHGKRIKK